MKSKSQDSTTSEVPRKWARYFRQLEALREALRAEREVQGAGVDGVLEPGGADDMDRAREESDHDLALGLLCHEENALTEVEEAIQRILNGTYGICEETGKPIPEARLRIVPWTRYTKEAMERIELQNQGGRPRLAEVSSIRGSVPGGLADAPEPDDFNSTNTQLES